MPVNPFGGIGSHGDARSIAEQTRALRAYEQARKRLLSSMKGEERAVAGLAAAHSAAMANRSRDSAAYERELTRTAGLLSAQGTTLKNLDATRERYHREEIERSESLLQHYESLKQALREIQEDSDDTRTILGSVVHPFKVGIDQMLRFGKLPKVTAPIRDTAISFDDLTGSVDRSAGAAADLGRAMADVFPAVLKYRNAVEELNVAFKGLKVKYADATEETEKLAGQFITLSKTDIVAPGAVESIVAVTDSLKFLEAQGVSTGTALSLLVERSRKSGRTFEESAHDVELVAAQADILRESLEGTDNVLQGFAFTVRDDFVRAIADATRNLDSQVVSIENVSAAYAYAARQAAEYGLSAEGAEKVSKAFAGIFFKEREDAVAFLSGRELQNQLSEALKDAEDALGVTYEKATEDQKRILEDAAFRTMGITATDENRAALKQSISTLGEGLGEVDIRNLLAGTTTAIKADLDAQLHKLGISKITDTSVASRLLSSINGFEELTTLQKRTLTDILMNEGTESAADEIARLQDEAMKKADDMKDMTSSALTAVLTMKDPIQQLFNIKDFLKSIALNVSNIVKLIAHIPGLGGVSDLYRDFTGEALRGETAAEDAAEDERRKTLESEASDLNREIVEHKKSERDAERERAAAEAAANERKLIDAFNASSIEERKFADLEGLSTSALKDLAAMESDSLGEAIIKGLGVGEEGREAGVIMARRTAAALSAPAAAAARAAAGARSPAPGEMAADGTGEVTVNAAGESVMTVRMTVRNMGEVIAHHTSNEARILDQFGLGG